MGKNQSNLRRTRYPVGPAAAHPDGEFPSDHDLAGGEGELPPDLGEGEQLSRVRA